MSMDTPNASKQTAGYATPPHDDLIIYCIGVAAMEIRKIADQRRRQEVARNAAAALRDVVSNG